MSVADTPDNLVKVTKWENDLLNEAYEVFNQVSLTPRQLADSLSVAMEALKSIAETAQAASQHQPESFCEWAFNSAREAYAKAKQGAA